MTWLASLWQGVVALATALGEWVKTQQYRDNRGDQIELEKYEKQFKDAEKALDYAVLYNSNTDIRRYRAECRRLSTEIANIHKRIRANTGK